MEEGSLRCDANISIRPSGSQELGTKTELKNMNSFRFIQRGIEAEIARQKKIVEGGGKVEQETLHFDPASGAITSLRSKEEAHDYRYFPEPDLIPIAITEELLESAKAALPELPAARAQRFESELGLSSDTAKLLAFRTELADFYEEALAENGSHPPEPVPLANWVTNELTARLGDDDPQSSKVSPAALAQLVGLVTEKKVSNAGARQVLDKLVEAGGDPAAIVEAEGLGAMEDTGELDGAIDSALAANPDIAERLRSGDMKPMGVIIGHVMRETKGRADGGEVTRLVRSKLGL
jgi:aspartyl-tRNA(Asn)/glutamyl-tRNA(Gln) amidotransferase subunit B